MLKSGRLLKRSGKQMKTNRFAKDVGGLPFEVRVPNAETLEAMRQVQEKDGLIEYDSLCQLYGLSVGERGEKTK